jgi:hypothetical protein
MGPFLSFLVAMLVAFAGGAAEAVPREIGYQGRLTDASGQPLAGSVRFSFALFAASEGGDALWSETQPDVAVNEGVFHVALGSVSPLPGSVFEAETLWLEVAVDGETLVPRQRLLSAPYALRSERTATPPSIADLAGTPCNTQSAYRGLLEVRIGEPEGVVSLVCRPTGTFTLTVVKTGDGEGRVTSVPAGIDCGADCSEDLPALTDVTLQATAAPGSTLVGGPPPTVRVDADRVVEVHFVRPPRLTVQTAGSPRPGPCDGACLPYTGFVFVQPPGAVCGSTGSRARNATCHYEYDVGEPRVTTLVATPQADAALLGWEGCDAVDGTECRVQVAKGTLVRAIFGPGPH